MFIQTEVTPNPNSLKFLPGKMVSNNGSFEVTKKEETDNELVRNVLSINGVTGVFLGKDFISINKSEEVNWEDIKHIAISLINDFYATGKEFVIANELLGEKKEEYTEIEKKIISILESKIRPAVAKDGGDIKFKEKLSEVLIERIEPISKEIKKLLEDQKFLDSVLLEGSDKADKIASKKMKEMKELVGF